METTEWIAVVVCGILGLWIGSLLSDRYARTQEQIRNRQERGGASGQNTRTDETFTADNQSHSKYKAPPQWYEILEVPASSSLAEIKLAYRSRIQQYHPDRLEGMAPELQKLALEKSQAINAAYAEASRLKS